MIRASRTLVFRVVAAAVGINALAGITALLVGAGSLGETESKILLTALTLSIASILLLAPVSAWQRVRYSGLPVLPALSGLATGLAALIIVGALWVQPESDDWLYETVLSLGIIGVVLGHVCLLLLARPSVLRHAALTVSLILGLLLIAAVWGDLFGEGTRWRLIGITTILTLALSVLVPVRHWASGAGQRAESLTLRYCPYCGQKGSFSETGGTCSRCNTSFTASRATKPAAAPRA